MPCILTRRRQQVTFGVPGTPGPYGPRTGTSCPNQLIGGIIFCGSEAGRRRWIERLNQRHPSRFNYFVCFRDVQSPWALLFGTAEWASVDVPYIIW